MKEQVEKVLKCEADGWARRCRFLSLEKKVLTSLTAQWSIPALNPDHFVAAELHLQCVLRAFNPHYMHCPTKINLIAMCMYK